MPSEEIGDLIIRLGTALRNWNEPLDARTVRLYLHQAGRLIKNDDLQGLYELVDEVEEAAQGDW